MSSDGGEESEEAAGVLAKLCITKQMLEGDHSHLPRVKPAEFTNGLVLELRKLEGTANSTVVSQLMHLAPTAVKEDIEKCNPKSLQNRVKDMFKKYQKHSKNDRSHLEDFLKAQFRLPVPRPPPAQDEQSASSSTMFKLQQERKEKKACKRKIAQLEKEREDVELKYERLIQDYFSTVTQLQVNEENFRQTIQAKSNHVSELTAELASYNKANETLSAKLDSLQTQLSRCNTGKVRNLNKKVKRKDDKLKLQDELIKEKDQTIKELEAAASSSSEKLEDSTAHLQLSTIKKKVKSMQDSKRKLQQKLEKAQTDKQQLQADLEATVEVLHKKIKDLQKENTDLQQIQALMEKDEVKFFEDGKYSDEIREVVMDLLTRGVSMNKVPSVITTVLSKLAGKTVDQLPSKALMSRLLVEADCLATLQVGEAIISGAAEVEKGNCLHQDGTSKFHKKYLTFDATLPSGKTLTMSMSEVPSGDAAGITEAFTERCRELAAALCDEGEDVAQKTAQIITSFTSTMSDRGATNPLFNSQLQALRSELLPAVHENWDALADDVKGEMANVCNYFCKMHLLVNFATEANSTLKLFEDAVAEGSNPLAYTQQGESGAARLIRTACTAFTEHGSEKSGAPHYFNTHISHNHGEDTNYMVTFRGNRFNILFYNAAAVYHHHKHIISFVKSWPDPNGLLKAVKADATQKVYLAGVRALGIIDKTVTGPFFRLLGMEKSILGMNKHLHQMQLSLERWAKDASTLLGGEPLFNEEVVKRNKDVLFESLFAPSEDEELDMLTQQALEVVCAAILILLERQAEEQLPGGKYWQPSEAEQQKSQHVPTTNVVSERDFAVLDNLIRSKPNASSLSCEAYIMWLNNQTSTWLDNLDAEEKERHMAYARTHAASIHAKFLEKKQKIKEQRLEALLKKQKEKEDKKQKARQRKVALTEKVLKMGGVWKTAEEVDERVGSLNREQEKLEAVKNQLQFHKKVLNSEGDKELFQMTITRPGRGRHVFSSSEKISHLKEVISKNVTHSTDINSESEEEDEEREYVTLKEPEARTVQGIHETLNKKRQAETEKREVNRQKLSLPDYLKDPSKLVGCKIRQKFNTKDQDGNKVQTWYTGTVTEMMDGAQDPKDTEYLIVYDDENEKDEVYNLLSDLEKGELIVLNSD